MNAKYFEENGFEDFHGTKFHKAVLDHAACIANNLMFDAKTLYPRFWADLAALTAVPAAETTKPDEGA